MMGQQERVIVIGAGAAGLMAALWAAQGPRPVLLLEGAARPGHKILISGGGRCNVLPVAAATDDFHTDGSRHTLRNILAAWPLAQVRRFFEEEVAVPLVLERESGKLFPASNKARTVLDAMLTAVMQRGVELRLNARVSRLQSSGDAWQVGLASGELLAASAVVLATGGLSVPTTGSDGAGLRIVQHLGHTLVPTYPALTPLTTGCTAHQALAGVSLTATVRVERDGQVVLSQRGGFLFTHRGYSGPAILNVSHVPVRSTFAGGPRPSVLVQWTDLDASGWDERLVMERGSLLPLLREELPERLAVLLLEEAGIAARDLAQLRRDQRGQLVTLLTRYPLPWSGHEGYRVAEVTGGGVPLSEVHPATLESRIAPGLYLCGEMLDAFGPIGGYNFLWAWVTGKIAGLACNR